MKEFAKLLEALKGITNVAHLTDITSVSRVRESANESISTLGFMSFPQNVSGVESAIGTSATLVDFSNGASGGSP